MLNNKIAVVGDKDSILAFKAVGADVFSVTDKYDAEEKVKKLARTYAIIFISEDIAAQIEEITNRYKTRPFPIVLPIPTAQGSTGYGMAGIGKNVEKAIGSDILNKK